MQLFNECFFKVKNDCFKFISSQETKTEKFKNKDRMIRSFLIPTCFWIAKKTNKKKPLIIGLSGGQGTGKTTITSIITIILKKYFKLDVFKISIDDFYKTRKQRILLSKYKHPLLMTRGVPGTHDINIMLSFFKKIKFKKFKSLKLPKFNKAVDDRHKQNLWHKIQSKPDVVILEGWCVGARPQNFRELKKPINALERMHDQTFKWRQYVNYQLKTKYKKLFSQLDGILFLKVKNFSLLRRWRLKQEKKLWLKSKNKKNLKIMNKNELRNFMDTYQRITQQMLKDMPKYSSIIMYLNNNHQIKNIKSRSK
jgi:D-glycerate 3-kinase